MRKKNRIEQELNQKEFENELNRDLSDQYNQIQVDENLREGTNKYVLAALHFFSTFLFFELFYLLVKLNINYLTLGYTIGLFQILDFFIHIAVLYLSIDAIRKKRSAVEVVIDRWPF
jgi:uncharacterized membrane protein (GlpM family)